ncbi:helicase domain protein [Nitzschia inconspicua]|uniref:Helicase domain protein n=1 Tax=Nitzschia inconspicua TaxID=303405 RepID=A0A9K3K9E3_9STRA|nr:helicase domain protein [Nitzschia inconspicua]KAG7362484.1 helicase domain protein [Nitzschia inconspicua]
MGKQAKKFYEKKWMYRFDAMKKFFKKYNTTKVSQTVSKSYHCSISATLTWAQTQRKSYNHYIRNETSLITAPQIDLLNSIGFAWNVTNKTPHEKWIHEYFKLYWHHLKHNNTVISESSGYNSDFVYWVEVQKRDYMAGKLAQGQIDLMNEVNFDWTLDPVSTWEDMYEQLSEYYIRFGSTLINTYINRELGMWTSELRMLYSKGDLDPIWVAKLNDLKFDWEAVDVNWNAMFDRLVMYKTNHGTVCVPSVSPYDPPLGFWVWKNRRAYRRILTKGKDGISLQNQSAVFEVAQEKASNMFPASIHAARLLKLLEIEFVWSPIDAQWQEMYDKLVAYKKSNGHTWVPRDCLEHPGLGIWVRTQRNRQASMSEARKRALDAIGFVWCQREAKWQEMYHKFIDMQAHNVSDNYGNMHRKDRELNRWIINQRQSNKKGILRNDRFSMLELAGFDW